jgi:hypothetical protein
VPEVHRKVSNHDDTQNAISVFGRQLVRFPLDTIVVPLR